MKFLQSKIALIFFIVSTIFCIVWMRPDEKCLYTYKPNNYANGIIGLEMTADTLEWKKFFSAECEGRSQAALIQLRSWELQEQVKKDFLFILSYGLLIISLFIRMNPSPRAWVFAGVFLTIMVMIFDILENMRILDIALLYPISIGDVADFVYKYAFYKWMLLVMVISLAYFVYFKSQIVARNVSIGLGFVLCFLFLWNPDIGPINIREGVINIAMGGLAILTILALLKKERKETEVI